MIVVSDASPISGLILIDKLQLLQQIFQTIVIPPKVHGELLALEQFGHNINAFKNADWILVKHPTNLALVHDLKTELDTGEAEAIALAEELSADYLLIDEKRGRTIAAGRGLHIIGVLGILVRAKENKYIPDVKTVLHRLKVEAGIWIEKSLEEAVLKQVGEA